MIDWDAFVAQELGWIAKVQQPPSRVETIKMIWGETRDHWAAESTPAGLIVMHNLGIIDPVHFEQKRYGSVWVIEAEGVIVERLDVIPAL